MQITMPNVSETLTYTLVAALGVDVLLLILLAVRGDWLGVILVLAVAAGSWWMLCRHRVAVVSAAGAAAAGAAILLLAAIADLAAGYPYHGVLFLIAAVALGFAFLLLRQGTEPAALRVGGILAIEVSGSAGYLAMLAALRDAGILTPDEYAAKSLMLRL